MEPLIKVCCIKHIYADKTEVNLCGLKFEIFSGDKVAILGPNGSGKTTLLLHILGLISPVQGEIEVLGLKPDKNFKTIRKEIGVVFQNVNEQIIGPLVYDDIAFTARNSDISEREIKERIDRIASMMNIESILNKIPHYLSGGQKKKVALAGAIIMNPRILILDEPFDGLDPKSKIEIIKILNKLNKENNTTIIITTHDINIVSEIADKVYVIDEGHIKLSGKPLEVFQNIEVIKEASLEPPILIELFKRLQKNGLEIKIPENIEEAEEILLKLVNK